jgi:hypothetical protein
MGRGFARANAPEWQAEPGPGPWPRGPSRPSRGQLAERSGPPGTTGSIRHPPYKLLPQRGIGGIGPLTCTDRGYRHGVSTGYRGYRPGYRPRFELHPAPGRGAPAGPALRAVDGLADLAPGDPARQLARGPLRGSERARISSAGGALTGPRRTSPERAGPLPTASDRSPPRQVAPDSTGPDRSAARTERGGLVHEHAAGAGRPRGRAWESPPRVIQVRGGLGSGPAKRPEPASSRGWGLRPTDRGTATSGPESCRSLRPGPGHSPPSWPAPTADPPCSAPRTSRPVGP